MHGCRVVLCPWHEVTLVALSWWPVEKYCSNAKFPVGMCLGKERGTWWSLFWGLKYYVELFHNGYWVGIFWGGLKSYFKPRAVWGLSPGDWGPPRSSVHTWNTSMKCRGGCRQYCCWFFLFCVLLFLSFLVAVLSICCESLPCFVRTHKLHGFPSGLVWWTNPQSCSCWPALYCTWPKLAQQFPHQPCFFLCVLSYVY